MAKDLTPYNRVLLANGQSSVSNIIEDWLKGQGCHVTTTNQKSLAQETFESCPHDFDLVVMDYIQRQPDDGTLYSRIRRLRPQMPIILLAEPHDMPEESLNDHEPFSLVLNKAISKLGFLNSLDRFNRSHQLESEE